MQEQKGLDKLRKQYVNRFEDYFPNIGISPKMEKEIVMKCLEADKDAYELGFFDLESGICY